MTFDEPRRWEEEPHAPADEFKEHLAAAVASSEGPQEGTREAGRTWKRDISFEWNSAGSRQYSLQRTEQSNKQKLMEPAADAIHKSPKTA